MGLKQQVAKGVSWTFFEQITRQLISVGVTVVLARILSPKDYGLVALSSIFVGFVFLFDNLSIGSALIQKSDIDDRYLSTSFWSGVFTGIILILVLCIIAPFAARYYKQPLLAYLIDVSAANLLASAISSTHRALLAKNLRFDKLYLINILTVGIGGLSALTLALFGMGVWSLVLSELIASILIAPVVWHLQKWRPSLIFDRGCFKNLFSFSSYLLSSNVIFYFSRNADNLIVGKYLGADVLGIYSMAYTLMMKPLEHVSWAITRVLFPAFSSIQKDIARIGAAYLKVVWGIALITFPMMMGLMMVAREFILVVVGPQWVGVVPPLQVLCLVGALQSIGTTSGSVFNSLGRTDLLFKTGVIGSGGVIIGFMVCIRWGLMGLVEGYLVTNIIFTCFSQYFVLRLLHMPIKDFISALIMPAINSAIMVLALTGYKYLDRIYFHMNMYLNLVTSVCLGVLVYMTVTFLFMNKNQFNEIRRLVSQRNG